LKFWEPYNRVFEDTELNDDPYFGLNIQCKYHDIKSLSETVKEPIFLSINIQSLQSKYDQLLEFIFNLSNANIIVDAIAVQEIWDIKYSDLVNIPGFRPIVCKTRQDKRGGGVGFYIRNNLTCSVIDHLSPFESKIFESITIQLTSSLQ
jgi:hypothetical protein